MNGIFMKNGIQAILLCLASACLAKVNAQESKLLEHYTVPDASHRISIGVTFRQSRPFYPRPLNIGQYATKGNPISACFESNDPSGIYFSVRNPI